MKTKLLAICLAGVGLGSVAIPTAGAREIPVSTPAIAALPATARINAVEVNIEAGRRHHRRSRSVRRVHYRHGHRVVTYRRVYY